jgi:GT2 family glycosyltransferase/2-phospho-L-lactate transferase/gluconeogenesis factor (CofD/UPF0052 family)
MKQLTRHDTKPKILIFCGGRGSGELAVQLLDSGADVTCCVNAYDDGLSTGRLRQMFGELGPSDIRKNLLSLMNLDASGYWSRYEVFSYRYPADETKAGEFRREIAAVCRDDETAETGSAAEFSRMLARASKECRMGIVKYLRIFMRELESAEKRSGVTFSFSDCAVGNCVLMGAFFDCGRSWTKAIAGLERMLITRGKVEIVSEEDRHLFAVCSDGRVLASEASVITDSDGDIAGLFLAEKPVDKIAVEEIVQDLGLEKGLEKIRETIHSPVGATASAAEAIAGADVLIYGSGTFYSSILPTLQIEDVKQAVRQNSSTKVMILNIVEEADTRRLSGLDLVERIAECAGKDSISHIAANLPGFGKDGGHFTLSEAELKENGFDVKLIKGDFESRTRPGRHDAMLLVQSLNDVGKIRTSSRLEPSKLPLVTVLMLAWNRKDDVEIGLNEMRKMTYPNVEMLLVDNGSTDGTAHMVYERFPEVNVVRLHTNTGMTGYNAGLATARGKYVIMLDDDSHLATDAVAKMVKSWETEENKDVGAMSFRVINPHSGSLVTHLWEERLAAVEPGREREITSFAACGAAVRRDVLDEVGYFDDDFFLYATEDDLSIRIWNAGYKIIYEPRAISYHRESRKQRSWKRYGSGFRNATWFNLKHLPLYMLPTVFIRNLFWLVTRSIRFRSFAYFYYGLVGLLQGYLQFYTPLKKRKKVNSKIAKFCLSDMWITRPIFSTSWKIYKDKRYILDKRGVSP